MAQPEPFAGISLQGVLTDSAGIPLDGEYQVTVRIYKVPSGGQVLYSEDLNTSISGGLLNLNLGVGEGSSSDDLVTALSPDSSDSTYERYFTMEVGGDGEMSPRRRITGSSVSAYALDSKKLEGVGLGELARLDQTNTFVSPQVFFPNDPDIIPITVRGTTGQTADLQKWQDSTGNALASISGTGDIAAAGFFGKRAFFQHPQPDFIPAIIRGSSGQTANLQEWQDNAGNPLAAVSNSGGVIASGFWGSGAGLTSLDASSLVSGMVSAARGGLGFDASFSSSGSILYASSIGTWSALPPGSDGQVLKMSGTNSLTWGTDETGSGGVTQINEGTGMSFSQNPITTTGTVSIDLTVVPLLSSLNSFTRTQTASPASGLEEGLIIRGNVNQVADLWRCEDNSSNALASCDASGNISANSVLCSGQKCAVVPTSEGVVRLYAQESPEYWFEDFGEGDLAEGRAHIELDPLFLETVTIDENNPIKVFIQPNGDFNTFVKRYGTGFDVIQSGKEKGNGHFTYRVVAKRNGYQNHRLEKLEDNRQAGL